MARARGDVTLGEQIASVVHSLYEHARSPLERMVLLNAFLLCKGVADHGLEPRPAEAVRHQRLKLRYLDDVDPMRVLQHLEEEARRYELQVAESVLSTTISLWMIAADIEMISRRDAASSSRQSLHS